MTLDRQRGEFCWSKMEVKHFARSEHHESRELKNSFKMEPQTPSDPNETVLVCLTGETRKLRGDHRPEDAHKVQHYYSHIPTHPNSHIAT